MRSLWLLLLSALGPQQWCDSKGVFYTLPVARNDVVETAPTVKRVSGLELSINQSIADSSNNCVHVLGMSATGGGTAWMWALLNAHRGTTIKQDPTVNPWSSSGRQQQSAGGGGGSPLAKHHTRASSPDVVLRSMLCRALPAESADGGGEPSEPFGHEVRGMVLSPVGLSLNWTIVAQGFGGRHTNAGSGGSGSGIRVVKWIRTNLVKQAVSLARRSGISNSHWSRSSTAAGGVGGGSSSSRNGGLGKPGSGAAGARGGGVTVDLSLSQACAGQGNVREGNSCGRKRLALDFWTLAEALHVVAHERLLFDRMLPRPQAISSSFSPHSASSSSSSSLNASSSSSSSSSDAWSTAGGVETTRAGAIRAAVRNRDQVLKKNNLPASNNRHAPLNNNNNNQQHRQRPPPLPPRPHPNPSPPPPPPNRQQSRRTTTSSTYTILPHSSSSSSVSKPHLSKPLPSSSMQPTPIPLSLRWNVYEVRYEEVQRDERDAMRRLLAWLGAPAELAEKFRREETAKKTSEDLREVILNFGSVEKFLIGLDVPIDKCPLLDMYQTNDARVFADCDVAFLTQVVKGRAASFIQRHNSKI